MPADLAEGHSGHKRPTHPSPQPRSLNFPILNFFLSPRSNVALLLGSVYNLHFGAARVHDNKNKTRCFPVTRPQIGFFTKHHQSLSGQFALRAPCRCLWRSSQPPARGYAFVFPRRPCPPPPARSTFHRDHHMPIPSSHVHLSTRPTCPR
jgi:hypothetical protein